MKEVMAVIRMNMINRTKRALADAGITSITAREAVGRGRQAGDDSVPAGVTVNKADIPADAPRRLVPKRVLTIILPNQLVRTAVDTIIKANQSGNAGDGKIFVMPVMDAVRVRTGERGEPVLDEA